MDLLKRADELKPTELAHKRKGPPNRMNDLSYKDWMKFQKSFFRFESFNSLVKDCIEFFTKARWPGGEPSKSLIIAGQDAELNFLEKPRIVRHVRKIRNVDKLVRFLGEEIKEHERYDFVLIDLRSILRNVSQLSSFLTNSSSSFFGSLRQLLAEGRYCCILTNTGEKGGGGFPIPWALACSSRKYLKLRDEKVGLVQEKGEVFYSIFLQAAEDSRPAAMFDPERFEFDKSAKKIPAWVIPKPPPRKKNEILHPAKYPETLVEMFVELFTKPGEFVFDPMVGTGSTIIAAIRKKRVGLGIDLNDGFVDIAEKRIREELNTIKNLFEPDGEESRSKVLKGDATHLADIPEIKNYTFDYVITSPPYWSMLSNPGSENQQARRIRNLPLTYSNDPSDLANISDYEKFLDSLKNIYDHLADMLREKRVLTVVLKNVKRNHVVFPLAWDLTRILCRTGGRFRFLGNTFWCQDDVPIKPFAVGIYWVSNVLHQYCLHFQKK